MKSLDAVVHEVTFWQRATFPVRYPLGMTRHLIREAQELEREIAAEVRTGFAGNPDVPRELADVAILLFGIADALGLDLAGVVERKMIENRTRRWKQPDAHGVIEHEEE